MASTCDDASVVAVEGVLLTLPAEEESPPSGDGVEESTEERNEADIVFVTGRSCLDNISAKPGSAMSSEARTVMKHDEDSTTDIQIGNVDTTQEAVLTLSSTSDSKLEELWQKLEGVMVSRLSSVQQVMEEFGVTDAQPTSQELEEQVWRVVEGELSLQEAADLV